MLFERSPLLGLRLILFIIISLLFMILEVHQNRLKHFRNALDTAIMPIQYAVDWPLEAISWAKLSFSSHKALTEENTHLKAQLLLSNAKVQKLLALEKENSQLRALLQSSSRIAGKVKQAQLLAVNLDPYVGQVIVNKGRKNHVHIGQPVLDATGVMGQVIKVGELTSRVMLITDSRSAVPVEDDRNGFRAILLGRGPSLPLTLINVPETADIKNGDLLVTSGLGLRYPPGYPVGVVVSVSHKVGDHFATIKVRPNAHLNRSRQVLLVWEHSDDINYEARQAIKQMGDDIGSPWLG